MSGSGKKPTLPPKAAPAPVPESIQEGAVLAGELEARSRRRQKGRRSLILTEGSLGASQGTEQKKSLLG
jgi:hypothetical protein